MDRFSGRLYQTVRNTAERLVFYLGRSFEDLQTFMNSLAAPIAGVYYPVGIVTYRPGIQDFAQDQDQVQDQELGVAGEYNGKKCASFDSLLSPAGLGHLGKVRIVRDTTTRRLPYWALGSSTQIELLITDFNFFQVVRTRTRKRT